LYVNNIIRNNRNMKNFGIKAYNALTAFHFLHFICFVTCLLYRALHPFNTYLFCSSCVTSQCNACMETERYRYSAKLPSLGSSKIGTRVQSRLHVDLTSTSRRILFLINSSFITLYQEYIERAIKLEKV
jgi:hypothetical protein